MEGPYPKTVATILCLQCWADLRQRVARHATHHEHAYGLLARVPSSGDEGLGGQRCRRVPRHRGPDGCEGDQPLRLGVSQGCAQLVCQEPGAQECTLPAFLGYLADLRE